MLPRIIVTFGAPGNNSAVDCQILLNFGCGCTMGPRKLRNPPIVKSKTADGAHILKSL